MSITVAVFVPPVQSTRPPPSDLPIVRALTNCSNPDVKVVFGFDVYTENNIVRIKGLGIKSKHWIELNEKIDIIHDRFPSQIRRQHFEHLQLLTQHLLWGNPFETTMFCRDKLLCQQLLESEGCQFPEVIDTHSRFKDVLDDWGSAFLKPRFGALGIGVTHVVPGTPLPSTLPSVVPNQQDPSILQRAIQAPKGWQGMSVRQLIQKLPDGSWIPRTPVLRHSQTDPVVNVARGAQASPAATILPSDTIDTIQQQSLLACQILDNQPNGLTNVEFGLDFVIDPNFEPWLIEINSRPRGRLEFLAEQFPEQYRYEHEQACIQPILTLASIVKKQQERP